VSKFHLIWYLVAQESKLRRKFLGVPDISDTFTGYIQRDRTYPVQDMSAGQFQQQRLMSILSVTC
jgi:hypothetical protein